MRLEQAFGLVLRDLRGKKGLTQERLALEANLDRTYISLLERGLSQPSLRTIVDISSILEVTAAYLVGLVEEKLKTDLDDTPYGQRNP